MKDARPPIKSPVAPGDERTLMQRLRQRDQAAFVTLYDRYAGLVYSLALRMTGNPAEAEEVVVDSFWQVWQQLERYDDNRGGVGAWIFTIARSRALDRLRLLQRSSLKQAEPEAASETAQLTAASNSPEQDLWLAEQAAFVRAALAELTPGQKEAIELAFYHGLSHTEIAERLGEPLGTIKTRIRLGLMKMRGYLSKRLTGTEKSETS